jgi:hypothetical protein
MKGRRRTEDDNFFLLEKAEDKKIVCRRRRWWWEMVWEKWNDEKNEKGLVEGEHKNEKKIKEILVEWESSRIKRNE